MVPILVNLIREEVFQWRERKYPNVTRVSRELFLFWFDNPDRHSMINQFFEKPILNSPYEYPNRHWEFDKTGQPTQRIIKSRRKAEFITPIPKPKKKGKANQQVELDLYKAKIIITNFHAFKRREVMELSKGNRALLQGRNEPLDTGQNDPLHLVVEIKGYKREDARIKKETMETYWIPCINYHKSFGRWAFYEFTDGWELEKDLIKAIKNRLDEAIEKNITK